ncbi:MAG TPA: hypothetical protein VN875_18470 [Candidatus Binatus sp.]|nr:hypothetical protein [Candidatus Binatus sp.]
MQVWKFAAGVVFLFLMVSSSFGQTNGVRVQLSLRDGKVSYRIGEPIVMDLGIAADERGYAVNTIVTEPASPIDQFTITPSDGVFNWLADSSRGHPYVPDYVITSKLEPGDPQHIFLLLNAVYRFDKPGNYTVRLSTARVLNSDNSPQGKEPLTTNDVSFTVTPMEEAAEQALVNHLMEKIRSAPDLGTAQEYVDTLRWLTGEPSTRAKVDLFFHPQVYEPFGTSITPALWVARDRELIVKLLEQSMTDPSYPVAAALQLAAEMKATLTVPPGPSAAQPTEQAQEQFEQEYLQKVAATLPQRGGRSLAQTAETVFTTYAQKGETYTPQFAAAQEVLITHFGDVSIWHQDWLLNSYGQYLADQRIVPALKHLLEEKLDDTFQGTKSAALKRLMELAPAEGRPYVVEAACNPTEYLQFDVMAKLPADSLPEVDDCLLSDLQSRASGGGKPRALMSEKAMLAGRFATKSVYPQMLALYQQYGSQWGGDTRGGILAYLAHWDTQGGLKLLQAGIALDGKALDVTPLIALCKSYYSPAVDLFFREALQREEPLIAKQAAFEISQHGPAEDEAILRARLAKWQKEWARAEVPPEQYTLQAELIHGLIEAKNWREDKPTTENLKAGCTSETCKRLYPHFFANTE